MGKKFDKLSEHVARYYEAKGVSPAKAKLWGDETAAKVYHEKEEKTDGK